MKNLFALLRGITSKVNGICFCINCLHSSRTESKPKLHESKFKNHSYCNMKMPGAAYNKILKFNQEQKPLKIPFVIYADTE